MGTLPQRWEGQRYSLRKTFDSDELAAKDGYSVAEEYYILGEEQVSRKKGHFFANITTRTYQRGWIRVQVKIPVIYGEPWKEELKKEIEKELKCNHDLIGVFLGDVGQQWSCREFEISWEE